MGGSLTVYLASQADPWFDPIFEATIAPVRQYSQVIWMQTVSLGSLERAWRVLEEKRRDFFSWQHASGPLSVVCLSLLRVGWYMESSTLIRSDTGEVFPCSGWAPSTLWAI